MELKKNNINKHINLNLSILNLRKKRKKKKRKKIIIFNNERSLIYKIILA